MDKSNGQIPEELLTAIEYLIHAANKHGAMVCGMVIGHKPKLFASCIGNVTEKGHDFAELLRQCADIVDNAESAGLIESRRLPPSVI